MKNKFFSITILLFLITLNLFAQKADLTKCEKSKIQAQTDLKNKKICFMFQGGFAPIRFVGKEAFEQKYKIKLIDLGCVAPTGICIAEYNAEVAKYLDQKYGRNWRKAILSPQPIF